ncbi:phage baseplate assembly protein, partial [Ralstonia solanacearum]|nr:phage baseplate assembly protein [Ralstonia solanacearum]
MTGMNSSTGRALADLPHLAQSMGDILTTPIGSRV